MANELSLLGAGSSGSGGGAGNQSAFPGTGANDAAVGSVAWTDTGNALLNDGLLASVSLTLGVRSNYLKLTNFGFAVPGGAAIVGVEVTIDTIGSTGAVASTILRMVVGGAVSGDDKGGLVVWESEQVLGSDSDTWGLALTPAQVNASDFGVVLSTVGNAGRGSSVPSVDYVLIKVFYV